MDTNAPAHFESASATHPGKVRRDNEDACLDRAEVGLWAVADGMGGHQAGQFASRTVIEALSAIEPQHSAAALLAQCEASVVEANARLFAVASEQGATIGTTLVVLLTHGSHYACVWSGDSRLYRLRHNVILRLSRDHTEVQDLIERGLITAEEGCRSPRRNVITRAIGVAPQAELEIANGHLVDDDIFLLCSDGLTNHVSDAELGAWMADKPCDMACHGLLGLALERGGTDNVTVIVVRYRQTEAMVAPDPVGQDRTTIVQALLRG